MAEVIRHGIVFAFQGERRGTFIIHARDGWYYHKHNDRPGSNFLHLRCKLWKKHGVRCPGRAVVSRDGHFYVITRNHIGHAPDFSYEAERILRHRIMMRAASGDTRPFHQMVREEGVNGNFSAEVRSRLHVAHIRTSLRSARLQNCPPVPRNLPLLGYVLSLPQYEHITRTIDGSDNIYAGYCGVYCEGTISVVFVSRRMRHFLQQMAKIFADGTFKKKPKKPESSQLFNISVVWENRATHTKHTICVVRALMQSRTELAYNVLFAFLKHLMPAWDVAEIMCDHEHAQVNAWMNAFPNASVFSCLWHYAVDVFRYAKSLGLHERMQNHRELDNIVRMCCAIPLLPSFLLMQGLLSVGWLARQLGFMRVAAVRDFFIYINQEWMGRQAYLSVCGSNDRTNNVSEGVNATMGWDLPQDRPGIFEVIGSFVRQEDQYCVDLHALMDGRDASRARVVVSLANDDRIKNLTESLRNQQIGILQFLYSVCRNLQAPYDHVFP